MNLFIRTDASLTIGTGHVMRCLALAQGWQRQGGQVTFGLTETIAALEDQIKDAGMEVVHLRRVPGSFDDARQTIDFFQQRNISWVVIDGYHFRTDYQKKIKDAGKPLLVFDDCGHTEYYCADIVLNQNIQAHENLYEHRDHSTQLLLGTRYVLLRQEFLEWQGSTRKISDNAHNVLITLGGSDPHNQTLKVLKALQEIPDKNCEIRIVAGAGNPYFKDLQALIKNMPGDIRLIQHATGISTLMHWADIAVAAAGITSWELSFMGVPSLLMVLAENQRSNAERLDETGIAINLGWYEYLSAADIAHAVNQLLGDFNRRSEMVRRGRNLIDGHGVERVLRCMLHKSFTIRQATENDCKLLWEWANDPDVRSVSFSSDFIPWEQHVEWFHQRLRDPNYRIYIAVGPQGTPIGQVRYEIRHNESIISVSLDKHYRGQGYGRVVIKKACEEFFSDSDILKIHAYIRSDNKASVAAFINAGFTDLGAILINEHNAVHFILSKTTNGGKADEPKGKADF